MAEQVSFQQRLMKFLNEMHFQSQPKAANLYKSLILAVAILSYVIAFFFQRFSICIYSVLITMVISLIIVVPGQWPWWQRPLPKFAKEKSN